MTVVAAVRRSLVALGVAGLVALWAKFRGGDATAPHEGGWRELSGPELR